MESKDATGIVRRFGPLRIPQRRPSSEHQQRFDVAAAGGANDMRTATAYFAGAGTVIAAIAAIVGAGLLMADIMSPRSPTQGAGYTPLERPISAEPIKVTAMPAEPVPYLSASQLFAADTNVVAAVTQAEPQTEATNAAPAPAAQPAQQADTSAAAQGEAALPPRPPATPPPSHAQAAAPEDASAKTPDTEAKRAEDKRTGERRQQWTERRRHQQRRLQDLRAPEDRAREDTEPRREFTAEPVRIEMPQIRLFGLE
jgi:hypothetical protein